MSLELNGVEFAGVDPATGRWGTPILTHETNKTRVSLVHLKKPRNKYIWERAILTNCNGAANFTRAIEENSYPVETVVGISTDKACSVRSGEKLHEVLVSEEEVRHCVKRGAYYVIRPMLPELRLGKAREANALSREYSSGDNVLTLAETVTLLKRTRLMVENQRPGRAEELLR